MRVFAVLFLSTLAVPALAQSSKRSPQLAQASKPSSPPQKPQPPPTIANQIDRQVTLIEKEFVEAAEAMPDDKFNFTPEEAKLAGSDYKGVRTFALEVRHVATANYFFWGSITGDKMPEGVKGPNGPENLTSKADILKYLKDSFALGHKAAATLTAKNLNDNLKTMRGESPRLYLASFPVAHAFDHYGQMVEYLRMNGIVPPASRQNR
ncbi:MAG TPA: DinB family protein [Myxococcales bacterium]|jgi:uncharacterized damage-inducible protein DinB